MSTSTVAVARGSTEPVLVAVSTSCNCSLPAEPASNDSKHCNADSHTLYRSLYFLLWALVAMQAVALQALPIGPLSSRINLSVHSSLPALLAVLALVLTPQEPANLKMDCHHHAKAFCHSLQPMGQSQCSKRVIPSVEVSLCMFFLPCGHWP